MSFVDSMRSIELDSAVGLPKGGEVRLLSIEPGLPIGVFPQKRELRC